MVFEVHEQLLFALECLAAVLVAGVNILEVRQALYLRVETPAATAGEGGFLVALVAEEVLARVGHHSYVYGEGTYRAYLGLLLKAQRVHLTNTTLTLTTAFSPNTSSSS